ncbi:MAG: dienelactone hydrolase family protein [Algoriphagus sp.]|uniref:dienelactone hydrolase family protein n=2 Tax=Algoriphagus sp. TaxID=1872435 RepID=UPI002730D36A|nr:dienelactone hydrolase family protein [Algoriphagus sp.]MDP2043264.1 dienelactone hydrolase family protein [Algoriphagus sp.]MDP3474259.1 dienelactone hydrolase family protein [Algoriphagus sp.]
MIKPFLSLILILGALYFFPKEQSSHSDPFEGISICHSPSDDMAQFVNAPGFASFHPSPIPFEFEVKGEMVSFPTEDGMKANGYFIKALSSSDKWLFVYQEWWGLNDNIKQQAEVFYDDLGGKVNVLAIDMYDGKVTANPQEAGKLMQGVKEDRLESIVIGARKMAGATAQIANVGWCFGGSWSLKSALLNGQQNLGSVMYYGMPVRDVEKLKTLNSDVLGLFATEQYISEAVIKEFAANMETAGKKLTYKIFPAVHGFANPSNPRFDAEASKEAYGMAIDYLKEKFGV